MGVFVEHLDAVTFMANLQMYEPNIEACSRLIMLHILFYYLIQSKVHKKGSFKSQKV